MKASSRLKPLLHKEDAAGRAGGIGVYAVSATAATGCGADVRIR